MYNQWIITIVELIIIIVCTVRKPVTGIDVCQTVTVVISYFDYFVFIIRHP